MIHDHRKLVRFAGLFFAAACATSPSPSPSGTAPAAGAAAAPGSSAGPGPNPNPGPSTAAVSAGPPPKPVVPATTPPAPPDVNPFKGARFYVDPEFVRMVEDVATKTPAEAKRLRKLTKFPTAVWLETVETAKLAAPTMEAAAKQGASGKGPVVPVFVVYDLPNRDCAAEGSRGEFEVDKGGEARYQTEFIDVIAAAFAAHPKQRAVVVLEPDSLPNLITNIELPRCAAAEQAYRRGVAYAITKLSLPNVFIYLDAAHAGWLGWPKNLPRAVTLFKEVIDSAGGPNRIRGFALNVSNFDPVHLPGAKKGSPDEPSQDEAGYAADFAAGLAKAGITGKGFVIDTSRNGKPNIRSSPGNWCNVKGAGLGERPRVAPEPGIDAFFWVKTPGESDGTADPKAPRYDTNCTSDDAMPGAPQAGELFAPYLIELVKNAGPPL
jgi:cellulose 1,4-beta-cellobiosidase